MSQVQLFFPPQLKHCCSYVSGFHLEIVCHTISHITRMIQPTFMLRILSHTHAHTPHVEYDVEGLSGYLKLMLEIRVSRCTSACQCISRSSPELSADLSCMETELTGLQASLCHRQGSHQLLQREFSQESTAVLPHMRPD